MRLVSEMNSSDPDRLFPSCADSQFMSDQAVWMMFISMDPGIRKTGPSIPVDSAALHR
jgi:hypothetical protein